MSFFRTGVLCVMVLGFTGTLADPLYLRNHGDAALGASFPIDPTLLPGLDAVTYEWMVSEPSWFEMVTSGPSFR